MGYNAIILERDGHVATIRLNRPDKHNAINGEMSAELIECLDALEADDEVRVIVLTGAGEKAFCAGADMAEAIAGGTDARGTNDSAARAALRLLRVKKPTIAAVNGYAYGGGAVFAIHCDIRVCSDTAKFRFVGATYGLVVGASQAAAHRRRTGGEGANLHGARRRGGRGTTHWAGESGCATCGARGSCNRDGFCHRRELAYGGEGLERGYRCGNDDI